jgi:dGTPase
LDNYKSNPFATLDEDPNIKRTYLDKKIKNDKETGIATRTSFQRDKDRIIYSKAFRRLIHKTQVCFTGEMNEHIRTRLTHTLEVSQIARSIARQVHANEDLTEAIALGHDLGHTPFGHTGETVLDDFLSGKDKGIKKKLQEMYEFDITEMKLHFKHNFQSVRVLSELEEGYDFKGLNLTTTVLEGILKHTKLESNGQSIVYEGINDNEDFHVEQNFSCSLEGQIVALADEIAQVCHDIEDAIEGDYDSKEFICAQLLDLTKEFNISGLENEADVKEMIATHHIKYIISCIIGEVISKAVNNIENNMRELNDRGLKYPLNKDIATHNRVLVCNGLYDRLKEIEDNFVINNYKIDRMNGKSSFVLRQIIKAYLTNPKQLPDHVLELYTDVCSVSTLKEPIKHIYSTPKNIRYLKKQIFEENRKYIVRDKAFLRVMSDYIASMTDLYALRQYQKLYGGDSI